MNQRLDTEAVTKKQKKERKRKNCRFARNYHRVGKGIKRYVVYFCLKIGGEIARGGPPGEIGTNTKTALWHNYTDTFISNRAFSMKESSLGTITLQPL